MALTFREIERLVARAYPDLRAGPRKAILEAFRLLVADVTWETVEADLCDTPKHTGTFTITDSDITALSRVVVSQDIGPYTGKGTRADEAEMDQLDFVTYPANGSATVRWTVRGGARPVVYPHCAAGRNTLLSNDTERPARMVPFGRFVGNCKVRYQVHN